MTPVMPTAISIVRFPNNLVITSLTQCAHKLYNLKQNHVVYNLKETILLCNFPC